MKYRILRLPEVEEITGLRRSAIYSHAKAGTFPRPIKLTDRASGWISTEIEAWLERQAEKSRKEAAA